MKVAIVGGGAAGLMAAATLCEENSNIEVFLFEKNDGIGKKVLISGGGRCNVTTGIQDVKRVLQNYPRGGKFLSSAMYGFPPDAVSSWFESHGVRLKTEKDLRVFPVSDDGHEIVDVFERIFRRGTVHVFLKTAVTHIEKIEDGFLITTKNGEQDMRVDRVILTTGGQAYRQTGSTGDGYAFAQGLGHSITTLAPSLSSFKTRETWVADVSGVSFGSVTLAAASRSHTGPIVFTHKGVSGPAVFALSSLVAFEAFDDLHPLPLTIDLFPEMTADQLRVHIESQMLEHPKKQFSNILHMILPKSIVDILCAELGLEETPANGTSKQTVRRVIQWLKRLPLHVTGRGAGDEFVTAGGVDLANVDPRTMQSKKCPGLFFAGEVLDIDGFTGGFNLQASWATGRLAGTHARNE